MSYSAPTVPWQPTLLTTAYDVVARISVSQSRERNQRGLTLVGSGCAGVEGHNHRAHPTVHVSAALLLGVLFAYGIGLLEHQYAHTLPGQLENGHNHAGHVHTEHAEHSVTCEPTAHLVHKVYSFVIRIVFAYVPAIT